VIVFIACCSLLPQGAAEEVSYEDEFNNIIEEFSSLKEELARVKSDYGRLKEETAAKIKEDEKLRSENSALAAQLKELQLVESQTKNYKEQIKQLQGSSEEQVRVLQGKIGELQAISQEKDKTIGELAQNKEGLALAMREKDKIIAALEQGQQEGIKKQVEFTAKFKDDEDELTRLKNERIALETRVEVLRAKEDSLITQVDILTQGAKDKERTVADLTQKFQEFPAQVKEYEAKLAELQNEKMTLANQLDSTKTRELEAQKKQEALAVQVSDKDKAIDDLQARVGDYPALKERNRILFKDNKLFRQKIDGYSRKLYQVAILKDRLLKENAVLHYNLGVYYLQKQQYGEAIAEFEKDLELNPDDAPAHYNLGLIYAEYMDNKPKAIKHFKRYIVLDPRDKDADRAKKYIMTWEMWQDEKIEPHPQYTDK